MTLKSFTSKSFPFRKLTLSALAAAMLISASQSARAATCPFDNGGSSLENDGLVLTRYALGLRGAPMVANTSFAAGDAATIESNIACPSCGLRVTDDKDALNNPIFTVADATIISRKLAGFSGAALTNGLGSLGSGSRNTPLAVQSFLTAGCGATGGTVTSIATGAGLTGGAITTTGSIGLAGTQLLPTTACGMGQIAKWGGSAWICSADNVGGTGTVTSVAGGAGIVATGPNVVNGVLSTMGLIELANGYILPQGCAAGQVPKSGGAGTWVCAADNAGGSVTNAFVNGGNAFGAPGVIGTTDAQPMTVRSGGTGVNMVLSTGDGLRVQAAADGVFRASNSVNGSPVNSVSPGVIGATISGGGRVEIASSTLFPNIVAASYGTVGGGYLNSSTFESATVGGRLGNQADAFASVVAGGKSNQASGSLSNVGGGSSNVASGISATVGGGSSNIVNGQFANVSGGTANNASGDKATVAGGSNNAASGLNATVAGGASNLAQGANSFASGYRAKNSYDGAFLWADSSEVDFKVKTSELSGVGATGWATAANSFNVRATGGVWFVTAVSANGRPTAGPQVNAGSGTWAASSDRQSKTAITAVNTQEILRKVVAMPISSWQYLTETGVRHIGPMAQDFKRLFAVGRDDKSITTIDADGVALAAIQGLNQKLNEQIKLNKRKDAELTQLRAEFAAMKKKLGM